MFIAFLHFTTHVSKWRTAGQIWPSMARFVARVMSVLCLHWV